MNRIKENYISFLSSAMKENGCTKEIRTEDDVLSNLFYLSKEDGRGSRYIPLQYKRILEKLICGLFNSSLEYEDKKDVYFETIDGVTICNANVYWVKYLDDGTRVVLGHGFNSLALNEVLPGVFMTDAERASKWKATCIGGAKSRALYEGGIGLEFYGDIFLPEINLDEAEVANNKEPDTSSEKKTQRYSDDGMPIPQPKKSSKKQSAPSDAYTVPKCVTKDEDTALPICDDSETAGISLEVARSRKADVGNYVGMSLGDIYQTAPKNLAFLIRNSKSADVVKAASVLIKQDAELSAKLAK